MKLLIQFTFLLLSLNLSSQVNYNDCFTGERLRFDFVLAGTYDHTEVYTYRYTKEHAWGGQELNLTDTFRYGEMFAEMIDVISEKVIYSKGFSSLFKEWQLTQSAMQGNKAYNESITFPYPKNPIVIRISEHDSSSEFQKIFSVTFDPLATPCEIANHSTVNDYRILKNSGEPRQKVDIVMISEGYTNRNKNKFFEDAERSAGYLFQWEPYKKYSDKFNIHALFIPSVESGTDIPADSVWKNTAISTSFYTFGSERYLTAPDNMMLHEMASDIPYDQVCVLVNTDKYGGGGVYNAFTVFSADNEFTEFLFLHEFGHAFASLGDEYYTSPTAYDESIDLKTEPYQPNITTNISFERKWKNMISDTVPIPTPNDSVYADVVGLFEGAAYQSKGIYRPAYNCAMKSKTHKKFCPVCMAAIEKMILFYCDE